MRTLSAVILSTTLAAGAVQAHVTVQPTLASPGGEQVLKFVVGHGCSGQPTTALRIVVPQGVTILDAAPKAGWTSSLDRASAAGPSTVDWRGGVLATDHADDFQLKVRLPARLGAIAFQAFQSCGDTVVGWVEPVTPGADKPKRPAPVLTLTDTPDAAPVADASGSARPDGVTVVNGHLAEAAGKPLYTYDFDTMVGMSHCIGSCAATWIPFAAPAGARPVGDWGLIRRDDGSVQWTFKTKPLYSFLGDKPGAAPSGAGTPNWRLAQ